MVILLTDFQIHKKTAAYHKQIVKRPDAVQIQNPMLSVIIFAILVIITHKNYECTLDP